MELVQAHLSTGLYVLGYCILARRAKYTWKQNACILSLGLIYAKFLQAIYNVESAVLRNILVVAFFGALARLYLLLGNRRRNDTKRNSTDKCSLGVFMGSGMSIQDGQVRTSADSIGGHTAEMKALISSLDFNRYTPRTYVYCHGDEISLRIVSELETSFSSVHLIRTLAIIGLTRRIISYWLFLEPGEWAKAVYQLYSRLRRPCSRLFGTRF